MSPSSLRFCEKGVEVGFAKGQTEVLMANQFIFSLSVFLMCCLSMFFRISAGDKLDYTCSTPRRHIFFVTSCFVMALAVVSIIGMASALSWRHVAQFSQLKCEILVMSLCISGMFFAGASESHYAAHLLGEPQSAIDDLSPSDAWLLLMIDFTITVTHISLPIRWFVLLPLQVWGPLLYAVFAFGLGSPHANQVPLNFAMLLFLTLLTSLGKRTSEKLQRLAFWKILEEKSARCMSDFKLSQYDPMAIVQQTSYPRSVASNSSTPTTTASGDILQHAGPGSVEYKLHEVAEMGRREHWLIDTDAVRLCPGTILGVGGFGVVLLGSLHGTPVACKIPRSRDVVSNIGVHKMPYLMNELRILRLIRHPNLVYFLGACMDFEKMELALVFELLRGRTLDKFMESERNDPALGSCLRSGSEECQILVDVCCALRFLHEHKPNIVHSDLKPANIMIDSINSTVRAKLLDFGLASLRTRHAKLKGGTPKWKAPELRSRRGYPQTASDIYSLGLVMQYVLTGIMPKNSASQEALVPESGMILPTALQTIITACLSRDASTRPSIQDVHGLLVTWSDGSQQSGSNEAILADKKDDASWQDGIQTLREVLRHSEAHLKQKVDTSESAESFHPKSQKKADAKSESLPEGTSLRFPMLRITPGNVQQAMLFEAACHWNFAVDPDDCCRYHSIVRALDIVCKENDLQSCRTFTPDAMDQCPECGVLGYPMVGSECDACEALLCLPELKSFSSTAPQDRLLPVPEDLATCSIEPVLHVLHGPAMCFPKFRPTPTSLQRAVFFEIASRWNSYLDSASICCPYHEITKAAKMVCQSMRSRPCCDVSLDFDEQCTKCGVLGSSLGEDEAYICDVCGFERERTSEDCLSAWTTFNDRQVVAL